MGSFRVVESERRAVLTALGSATTTPPAPNAARQDPGPPPVPVPAPPILIGDPAHARRILHPFLGYVYDPSLSLSHDRLRQGYPPISAQGFYGGEALEGAEGFRVWIFGGSMAMFFGIQGRAYLESELAGSLAVQGRPVIIESFALGGYKQPQQLAALAYLLSLDRHPDVVVNLDGMNEVALPLAENRPRGVFPFYPRAWDVLVEKTQDPSVLEQVGFVAYLERRRAECAGRYSAWPWRYSATANLVWQSQDRGLARRIARAHAALDRLPAGPPSFAAKGPVREYSDEEAFLRDAVREWRTSSLLMSRLAGANGVRYFHFLQPNQYDSGSKPIGPTESALAVDPTSPFREPVRRGYPLLSQAGEDLRRSGVEFVDLRRVFSTVDEPLYIDTCCHVGIEGNRLLAIAIARTIRERVEGRSKTATSPGISE